MFASAPTAVLYKRVIDILNDPPNNRGSKSSRVFNTSASSQRPLQTQVVNDNGRCHPHRWSRGCGPVSTSVCRKFRAPAPDGIRVNRTELGVTRCMINPWRWRPRAMKQKQKRNSKGRAAKSVLRLPDLEVAKSAVLNSLSCPEAQRGYRYAIDEFVDWYCSEPRLSFSKTVVLRYRMHLGSAEPSAANWSRFNFLSGTFRCRPPSVTSAAPRGSHRP